MDAVKEKLDQIRREFGEDALPLAKFRSAKAKWRAIARITLLSRGFVPNYPEQNFINPRMFIEVFPYHLILNEEMKVIQSGIKIQQMMPLIRSSRTAEVQLFFNLLYPRHTDFTYENVKKFIMCPFVLEFKRDKLVKDWKKRPLLSLKGNFKETKKCQRNQIKSKKTEQFSRLTSHNLMNNRYQIKIQHKYNAA